MAPFLTQDMTTSVSQDAISVRKGAATNGTSDANQQQDSSANTKRKLLCSEQDLDQIWKWNELVPPTLRECIHDIVSRQADERTQNVAIEGWDGSLTYDEIATMSTKIAVDLLARGVGAGRVVPLCFEKSKWTAVALLGVMKTGAAFSLTDPSQPEARLRTIVEQTEATLVVTSKLQQELGQRIVSTGTVLSISQDYFDDLPEQVDTLLPIVDTESPMYVIFTSGSTGKPKGVVISHKNFTSGAIPRAAALGYKNTSKVFDFPSYAFDVSIDCMLCTLAAGGTIYVPSEEGRVNDLSSTVRDSKVTMLCVTPSVARVLDSDIIPSLETLGLGGEAVSASDAAVWGKTTNLVIAYGPSECTVGCTVNNTLSISTGIGKGCGGNTWIVDPEDHNILMPVGEVGELLMEGPVVGIGYLGEPEKTAEVFIEDPTWLTAGNGSVTGRHGRLYKTGDLVRYEDNRLGSIEFVGRKDQQVKLRGQRVELTEVEYHVQSCLPGGITVAAEVIKPEGGVPALICFLDEGRSSQSEAIFTEPSEELAASLSDIEPRLEQKAPRYMVPAAFITLQKMPKLVSGKIDRKTLRQIGLSIPRASLNRKADEVPKEEPVTENEKKLHAAWTAILGADTAIYRQSNFFSIGGDSLRAMRLIAVARDQHLAVTVADVFTSPTLRGLALKATPLAGNGAEEVLPFSLLPTGWNVEMAKHDTAQLCSISADEVDDVYPCSPLQEALMALSAKVKEAYVAQRVVALKDQSEADDFINALTEAYDASSILRTRIVQVPTHGLMQVVTNGKLPITKTDDLQSYLLADRNLGMALGTSLMRCGLVSENGRISFVLTVHHAIYDGWSMPLVVDRINKVHNGTAITRPAEFKHFIKYLADADSEKSAAYWKKQLDGAAALQFPQLPFEGYQTQADSLLEQYVNLEQLRHSTTTVATVIRAAWAIVVSQYIMGSDVVFGETLTGRNAPIVGAEEIEGPMITTIPFRVHVDGDITVAEYLQNVQEQTIGQIPHEHYGLQHIRRLSPYARDACELGTGLVLHPSADPEAAPPSDFAANRLVPAGDEEAAQEALKFNTYALMLVCAIDPKGFMVMASFDSKTVSKETMQEALKKLNTVANALCDKMGATLSELSDLICESDAAAAHANKHACSQKLLRDYPGSTSAYIVDTRHPDQVTPIGAVGELIIAGSGLALEALPTPSWIQAAEQTLYKTGRTGRYSGSEIQVFSVAASAAPAKKKTTVSATSRKQRHLRSLWSKVLRLPEEDISLDDSFFAIGGDSISAMKLVSEARAQNLKITVADMFNNKQLYAMARVASDMVQVAAQAVEPYALVRGEDVSTLTASVKFSLADPSWTVDDILPVRPLQDVAVLATVTLPRFSVRYELIYFDSSMDVGRLRESCQALVSAIEILHTTFVQYQDTRFAVVSKNLVASFEEHSVNGDIEKSTKELCENDVLQDIPFGSSFVKWLYATDASTGKSCLAFRISHAQYDEMCLPAILHQLATIYHAGSSATYDAAPFSTYMNHIMPTIPSSMSYWTNLLSSSPGITKLRPELPLVKRNHYAIERTIPIIKSQMTIATIPPAAWSLVLSRRAGTRDVIFGEVVSGRSIEDTAFAPENVAGPTWQYVPLRVKLQDDWTGQDLLSFVQLQHAESTAHESVALSEMAPTVPGWAPSHIASENSAATDQDKTNGTWWFDTVVHQAVQGATTLPGTGDGFSSKLETVYLHEEPLSEWKVQAFISPDSETLTLEIVTFESWAPVAKELLDEVCEAASALMRDPHAPLFG